jgi:enediyne biosynthesis protein E4
MCETRVEAKRILRLWFLLTVFATWGCKGHVDDLPQSAADPVAQPGAAPADARLPFQLDRPNVAAPSSPDDWFEDLAGRAGVSFAYHDGSEAGFYQLLESVGGGVAIFDYDGDGAADLFFTGGGSFSGPPVEAHGRAGALFRNHGGWRFTDATAPAGLHDASLYTHGVSIGDFNSDGFADVFVAGYGGCRLFQNQGDGGFLDVTAAAGFDCPLWNVVGAWADLDRDGHLDLYLVTYADCPLDHRRTCLNDRSLRDVCGPTLFPGLPDSVWRNRGDGRFEDITQEFGVVPQNRGLGVVAADVDENGWIDLFVVNDVQENQLYLNDGHLPLREEAALAGVAVSSSGEREGSMGVDVGDFNGDGRPDLWYLNYANQDNSLMQNVGNGGFIPAAPLTGLLGVSRPWVGFGTALADFDGDGWQDLVVANGHVAYDRRDGPYFQPPQLFHNQRGQRFVESTALGGPYFSIPRAGRGAAVGDLDGDGALDLVMVHQNEDAALLRNRRPVPHWVSVRLRGVTSNRDAVGAKVEVKFEDQLLADWVLADWVRGGGGYLSHRDSRILIPRPDDAPVEVRVKWPSGAWEVFSDLEQGQTHDLLEGMGRPG